MTSHRSSALRFLTMFGPQYPYPITPTRTESALSSRALGSCWGTATTERSAAERPLLIRAPLIGDCPKDSCWIACHDCARRNVACHDAAGANDGVFSDGHMRKDRRAGSDRGAFLHERCLDFPVVG